MPGAGRTATRRRSTREWLPALVPALLPASAASAREVIQGSPSPAMAFTADVERTGAKDVNGFPAVQAVITWVGEHA